MFLPEIGAATSQIFSLLVTGFWIWMLVDCVRNNTLRHKWGWFIFILFMHVVGAAVYFFTRGPWPKIYQWAQWTPPTYQAPRPTPKPTPTRETYPTYEQGYQAQAQHYDPAPRPQEQWNEQPSSSASPLQPQYEEPQIAYPEEPPLQQH